MPYHSVNRALSRTGGDAIRYEEGFSLGNVALVGACSLRVYPDVSNFRSEMKRMLGKGKNVVTDGGYPDERCNHLPNTRKITSIICARHETINGRFKHFFFALVSTFLNFCFN